MLETATTPAHVNEIHGVTVRCRGKWRHASSLRFVLPLRLVHGTYETWRAWAQEATLPGRKRPLWQPFALPVDDLMPHVRQYLNTENGGDSTATWLTAEANELAWLTGGEGASWSLQLRRGRSRRFSVSGAHLLLFRLDIAFLVVDIAPEAESATEWFDLLHYARFFTGPRSRPIVVERDRTKSAETAVRVLTETAAVDPETIEVEGNPVLQVRLAGLQVLLDVLFRTSSYAGETLATTGQLNSPGQMLAYPTLFLDGPNGADAAVLARVVGLHHSEQAVERDSRLGLDEALLPYGERSWLFTTSEGAGFIEIVSDEKATSFTTTTLPSHLRSEYFLGYVLAAFQRYALLRLSEEVAARKRQWAETQSRVLDFTGRAMFVQVTHTPHHQAWYRHVQRVHQVPELHQEVRDEVRAFQDFERVTESELHSRRSRVMEVLVAVITGVILPLQLVTALFADRVRDWPLLRVVPVPVQAYGTLVLAAALGLLTYLLLRRAGRSDQ